MSRSTTERLDPWRAAALRDLLEVDADTTPGAELPLLWHWVYLLDHPRHGELGPDGHRERPEAERTVRRMWAGGAVSQRAPLRTDRPATRTSAERSRATKSGSSGTFTVVTIRHEVTQDGVIAVEEDQHLVYREPLANGSPGDRGAVRSDGDGSLRDRSVGPGERAWPADERMLFRYSALTYNGHRIHYDWPYATGVEGYAGLVVHGPLQALLMAEHCSAHANPGRAAASITYRLVSPLIEGQGLVTGTEAEPGEDDAGLPAYVRDRTGRHTATARYRLLHKPFCLGP